MKNIDCTACKIIPNTKFVIFESDYWIISLASDQHWLGRSYCLEGEVIHGEKRGRQIGFPTANIDVWEESVIPANGVYFCLFG